MVTMDQLKSYFTLPFAGQLYPADCQTYSVPPISQYIIGFFFCRSALFKRSQSYFW